MASFEVKTYVVQKYDRFGNPGEVIDVKLTYGAAHAVAKDHAPAKVIPVTANKLPMRTPAPAHTRSQAV